MVLPRTGKKGMAKKNNWFTVIRDMDDKPHVAEDGYVEGNNNFYTVMGLKPRKEKKVVKPKKKNSGKNL